MEHKHTPGGSAEIERKRVESDLSNHIERLEWLSSDKPCWSCGTPVDAHLRNSLITQSQAFIARTTGATHE